MEREENSPKCASTDLQINYCQYLVTNKVFSKQTIEKLCWVIQMVLFYCHCFSICATLCHQHLHSLRGCVFLMTQGSPKCTLRQAPRQTSLQRRLWLLTVSKDCLATGSDAARLVPGRVLAVQKARNLTTMTPTLPHAWRNWTRTLLRLHLPQTLHGRRTWT